MGETRDIRRIGRDPQPGERAVQHAREHPDVLEYMARCSYANANGLTPVDADAVWAAMSEYARHGWIENTLMEIESGARKYDAEHPPEPPEPDGGLPLRRIA